MRVLVVHNTYKHRGGEDSVVESEMELLHRYGHEVESYTRDNDEIDHMSALSAARQTLWSTSTTGDIGLKVERFRPDVIHAHNTFPLVSPSLFWVANRLGVPVVQTLHNFRLMCLSALYLRDAKVCEDCAGKLPWRGVVHACYRGSRPASAVVAGMLALHRGLGTYKHKVARYIALNEFCRNKFIEGGLPADRIVVKPNFVDAPAAPDVPRAGLLFVGRLSKEKGIGTLAQAAGQMPAANLQVVGDGPEAGLLQGVRGLTSLGSLPGSAVREHMERALALVVPSIWYENFPRTIVEAFAAGLPVIASRVGALAELVTEGQTGLLFEPGDPADLASKMAWALAHPQEMAAMGKRARVQFEWEFSPEVNHRRLMAIYQEAQRARA